MKDWDDLCSAYAPIFNRNGEIVAFSGVDIDDRDIVAARFWGQRMLVGGALLTALAVSGGVYGFIVFRSQNRRLEAQAATLDADAKKIRHYNENLQQMVEDKTRDVLKLQGAILRGMAEIVEGRDDATGRHIERTQRFLMELVNCLTEMGLYQEDMRGLDINLIVESSHLHDVGKIGIPDSILKKPGPLSKEEFEEMKRHVEYGVGIIERIEAEVPGSDFLNYSQSTSKPEQDEPVDRHSMKQAACPVGSANALDCADNGASRPAGMPEVRQGRESQHRQRL